MSEATSISTPHDEAQSESDHSAVYSSPGRATGQAKGEDASSSSGSLSSGSSSTGSSSTGSSRSSSASSSQSSSHARSYRASSSGSSSSSSESSTSDSSSSSEYLSSSDSDDNGGYDGDEILRIKQTWKKSRKPIMRMTFGRARLMSELDGITMDVVAKNHSEKVKSGAWKWKHTTATNREKSGTRSIPESLTVSKPIEDISMSVYDFIPRSDETPALGPMWVPRMWTLFNHKTGHTSSLLEPSSR